MAEVVKHYYPRLVDLHNYTKSSSLQQKIANWETLNQKVLRKLNFVIHHDDIEDVVNARRNAIERVLLYVRRQMALYESQAANTSSPSSGGSRPQSTVQHRPVAQQYPQQHQHQQPTSYAQYAASGSSYEPEEVQASPSMSSNQRGNVRGLPGAAAAGGRGSISPRPARASQISASSGIAHPSSLAPPQRHTEVEAKSDQGSNANEQEQIIQDLRKTVELLQEKVAKLEQLVQLKTNKIANLTKKLEAAGLM